MSDNENSSKLSSKRKLVFKKKTIERDYFK